jgi:DNA polymerase-1
MYDVILIDGMNICVREAFSPRNLKHRGRGADVICGFFSLMFRVMNMNPGASCVVAWDGGSFRRVDESKAAVACGIVPEFYKENRKKPKNSKVTETMESVFEQTDTVREILEHTTAIQVKVRGVEGDDIINTYSKMCSGEGKRVLIVSADKDFYQCISDNVSIYTIKGEIYDKATFVAEFGIQPEQWVDKGALEGETGSSGDNIFGVPGFGEKNSLKYVREFGDIESIISSISAKEVKSSKESVLLAHIDRLRLARSLKKMDIIGGLPVVSPAAGDEHELRDAFFKLGLIELIRHCRVKGDNNEQQ